MAKRIHVQNPQSDLFAAAIEKEKRANQNRTTFRISAAAKRAMDIRVTQDGYGLRGKSRWIMDAAKAFLANETWGEWEGGVKPQAWKRIIIDTELHREPLIKDAINLPDEMRIMIWRAAIDAALYGAEMDVPVYLEITISSVIRAAVMWRLGQQISL